MEAVRYKLILNVKGHGRNRSKLSEYLLQNYSELEEKQDNVHLCVC